MYVSSDSSEEVWRFPAPFPTPQPGIAHSADEQIFKGQYVREFNSTGPAGLTEPHGVAVGDGQLFVADLGRLLFWNNVPDSLVNGKPADGYVGTSSRGVQSRAVLQSVRTDEDNHLYAVRGKSILVYDLPLVTGATPVVTITSPLPLRGGGTISFGVSGNDSTSVAPAPDSSFVWVVDSAGSRVLRIADPLTAPTVDAVVGQPNATATGCNENHGFGNETQTSLCLPGHLALDTRGDLFVADDSLEVQGNQRLLEYDAASLPTDMTSTLYAVPASRVYGADGSFTGPNCQAPDPLCAPWEPAISYNDEMVVGMNMYLGARFPLVYQYPLSNTVPIGSLKDMYACPLSAQFDDEGNLYVVDGTRRAFWSTWPRHAWAHPRQRARRPARPRPRLRHLPRPRPQTRPRPRTQRLRCPAQRPPTQTRPQARQFHRWRR